MANDWKIIVNNEKALKKLKQANARIARKGFSQALRAGGKIVLKQVKADIPVRTGATLKSLKLKAGKGNRRKGYIRFKITTTKPKGIEGDAFYYNFVEQGTRFIHAKHSMRRAEDKVRKVVISQIKHQVKQAAV